ncbi:hypothetical protein A2U01_0098192, partial [Trifolium medium]|nr:hypothetical protein [Trifolium medium]
MSFTFSLPNSARPIAPLVSSARERASPSACSAHPNLQHSQLSSSMSSTFSILNS